MDDLPPAQESTNLPALELSNPQTLEQTNPPTIETTNSSDNQQQLWTQIKPKAISERVKEFAENGRRCGITAILTCIVSLILAYLIVPGIAISAAGLKGINWFSAVSTILLIIGWIITFSRSSAGRKDCKLTKMLSPNYRGNIFWLVINTIIKVLCIIAAIAALIQLGLIIYVYISANNKFNEFRRMFG